MNCSLAETWSDVDQGLLSKPEAMRLDEINVLQASLTYSDEFPAPEVEGVDKLHIFCTFRFKGY